MITYRHPKYSCIGWHALVYAGMRWYAVVCVGMRLLVLPLYNPIQIIIQIYLMATGLTFEILNIILRILPLLNF